MRYLLLCVALAGCAPASPTIYIGQNGAEASGQLMSECRFEAVRASAGVFHPNVFLQAAERQSAEGRVLRSCMEARGYMAAQAIPGKDPGVPAAPVRP